MTIRCLLDQLCQVPTRHELRHDDRLAALLADVEHGNDVMVVTQPPHGLSLATHADEAGFVQPIGLDDSDGYLAIESGVVGEVDVLAAAFTQEALDLIAAGGER